MDKKKIIILIISAVVIWVFLEFIYLPKVDKVKRLKLEYKENKIKIAELYNFIGGENNLKDNFLRMSNYAAGLGSMFPYEREVSNIIKQLNEEAKVFKINVISIKPGDPANFVSIDGSQMKIGDYTCKSLPMNLSVEARYQALGDFLDKITHGKNPVICVTKVEMTKDANISPRISADIELSACALGE